jgi:hypothetical protein
MEFHEDELKSSALSIDSAATPAHSLDDQNSTFNASRTLHISAQGIAFFRFPLPSKELEIPIYNSDGSIAYISRRASRCSGNAVLSDPSVGDLIQSEYFFGPGRDPIISILQPEVNNKPSSVRISSPWFTRATSFSTPDGYELEWIYGKRKDSNNQRENLMVLRLKVSGSGKGGKILAKLIRGDQTRAPGSTRSRAGNGGQLLIDEHASKFVEEPLIVATCLLMLKKEIDRRRAVQFSMVSAMVGAAANS